MTINNEPFPLEPDFLCIPWGHRIEYQAHAEDPYFLGDIHIIPDLEPDTQITFDIAHMPSSPLPADPARKDCEIPGLEQIVKGQFQPGSALFLLAEYTVQLFQHQSPDEKMARLAAQKLLYHLTNLSASPAKEAIGIPQELLRLMDYVHTHIGQPITLQDLDTQAEKSPDKLQRLFKKYLHQSPAQWIAAQRLIEAQRLCRNTHLNATELADRLGFGDIYHFSKFFKHKAGCSIREYRTRHNSGL